MTFNTGFPAAKGVIDRKIARAPITHFFRPLLKGKRSGMDVEKKRGVVCQFNCVGGLICGEREEKRMNKDKEDGQDWLFGVCACVGVPGGLVAWGALKRGISRKVRRGRKGVYINKINPVTIIELF